MVLRVMASGRWQVISKVVCVCACLRNFNRRSFAASTRSRCVAIDRLGADGLRRGKYECGTLVNWCKRVDPER